MTEKDALTIFRTIQKCRHQALHTNDCGNCERCQYRLEQEQIDGAVAFVISALEKQERSNAQNVNSTHRSRPNALESLNILEQAKDDKGSVPMSLVRRAFRNILEEQE